MLTQEHYLANFTRVERSIGNSAAVPGWLDAARRNAISRFNEVGFPSNRAEDWRQTNVAAIAKIPFQQPAADHNIVLDDIAPFSFRSEAACEIVFINGAFAPSLSDLRNIPAGSKVQSLAAAAESGCKRLAEHLGKYADIHANSFIALNTGFITDGAVVYLDKGTVLDRPIHLLFISTTGEQATVTHPRTVIVAEANAEAKIVETYAGLGGGVYFTNAVTELVLGENSRIDHTRLQHETLESFHISTTQAHVARSANFITQSATLGAKLTRNDCNVVLAGEAAEATLNGLVLINGDQHCDNHTLLDHAMPHCPSHELYKHVLGGKSTGVFRGKILVRQIAQKTDSKQTSRSLLLSDDAAMNSQPALEIYADDVKCTHGSTIGPVNEEMMFYIRSRGVNAEAARALLTYAFAADITRRISVEPVRRYVENFMAAQHDLPQDLRITDLGRHDEQHR